MNNNFISQNSICSFHAYEPFAGQRLSWLSSDSEELYEKNLKSRSAELTKFGWDRTGIEYAFNQNGFRCAEFDASPGIIFLGCSHTMGIGLPESKIWTSLVSTKLGLRCWNLGLGGSSNDVAFRMAYNWVPKLTGKICVLMAPDRSRLEIVQHENSSLQINLGDANPPEDARAWYYSDHNAQINFVKTALAISQICLQHQVKFICATVEQDFVKVDYARDLCHWGVQSHALTADKIINTI